ncbi:MAG: HD-GYP domain-containing protein [Alicyclobacillus sp.]|nr:HD-GYP domain-containing protein [Alicyclobacillus sp.]
MARGMVLSESLVHRLQSMGIGSVCIEDERTADLQVREPVSPETKRAVLSATFDALHDVAQQTRVRSTYLPRLRKKLRPLVEDVIDQMREAGGAGEHFGNVYLSDGELYHHSVNMTLYALAVGLQMGLSHDQLLDLGVGSLLHDVGKLKIPEAVLKKPGRLTDEEFESMKMHTVLGYDLLRRSGELPATATLIALQHHERFDGGGYPRGLRGSEIHLYGRITAVVDVYEALTANRVYRSAYLPHEAYEMLLGGGGTQFDPAVVKAFTQAISIYPVGMTVVLSNGYRAVVIRSPKGQTQRPVVRLIENPAGEPLNPPEEIDLGRFLTLHIVACEG